MKSWLSYIEGVGEVHFYRHHKARRFILRIYQEEGIRVTVPVRASRKEAERFVWHQQEWVQQRISMVREKPLYTPETQFQTRWHRLDMKPHQRSDMLVRIMEDRILVRYPGTLMPEDDRVQNASRKGIEMALGKEAMIYLPKRLRELSRQTGIAFNRVQVKRMKTRWGSCSARNNINLNRYLIQLPDGLIDYVLLHELAHVRVKNHQYEFWALLDELTANRARLLDKQLKQHTIKIP